MPEWEVIYRATADFSDLVKKAAEARAALEAMAKDIKSSGDVEVASLTKVAQARLADTRSIEDEARALGLVIPTAQRYNREALFGGRMTMDEHLRDLQTEKQLTDLLFRSRQRGFILDNTSARLRLSPAGTAAALSVEPC